MRNGRNSRCLLLATVCQTSRSSYAVGAQALGLYLFRSPMVTHPYASRDGESLSRERARVWETSGDLSYEGV